MVISVNLGALNLVKEIIEKKEDLGIKVDKAENESTIIDLGIEARGGFMAGRYATEVCLGGHGKASLSYSDNNELPLPKIFVSTDYPAISLLGSQFAGWRINVGNYFAMGSGPARALPMKPKELYAKIGYQDSADTSVIVLETSEVPPVDALEYISNECKVNPDELYVLLTPTSSIAGSTQISGRIVETGMHKMVELGLDPSKILYGCGQAPIAPLHPKSTKAMGRTNDMIMYGGETFFIVDQDDEEELARLVEKTPSSSSPDYGKPFYEIFKEADFDFYKIDPALFAPAAITVNNIRTGKSFSSGRVNAEIVKESVGL
ncbi:MAG: methenyltetrahydromethanopterin cyclohydrolase [Candidatus Methylarchaceae archaeon HK01B]|nr:methenyltetrahydromethanopterin cyclohydrolase [Candidatus Methylarchaceae archaeon HK01M]MCP8311455.1 methenyltetrahydromethanopterin cyclohydrolase [Candidatus Methylarchaceae archaeon HK02M1]MCP8318829.1 methenyltetrahydromethanopterin cyclohydrolase [Candidatus Methylarchaceae archaeon HK01B]